MKKIIALILVISIVCTLFIPVTSASDIAVKAGMTDVLDILKHVARVQRLSAVKQVQLDFDGNGIDIIDALAILKGLAKMTELPTLRPIKEVDFQVLYYTRRGNILCNHFKLDESASIVKSLDELRDLTDDCDCWEFNQSFFEDKALIAFRFAHGYLGARSVIELTREEDVLTLHSTKLTKGGGSLMVESFQVILLVDRSDIEGVQLQLSRHQFTPSCSAHYGDGWSCVCIQMKIINKFNEWLEENKYIQP